MTKDQDIDATGTLPEGEELSRFVAQRRTRAGIWQQFFAIALILSILVLTLLLYNIIDGGFGYVALQNNIPPAALALGAEEKSLLSAPNLTSSEDDEVLANGVIGDPNAIGFFGYAYYQEHAEELKLVSVDGVTPNAETLDANQYPLARPLYIYSTANVLQEKPQVAGFVDYYLKNVNQQILDVGYFPASQATLDEGATALQAAIAGKTATGESGDISIAGSSTVFPLTQRMANGFRDTGFDGQFTIDNIGTSAGFALFCTGAGVDIANASRAINQSEAELCRQQLRTPIALRVGADAVAIVVNKENSFLSNITREELRKVFSGVSNWSEVNSAWPNQPIVRFVPGADSGTLDFFVESLFPTQLADLPKETLVQILQENLSKGLIRRFERDQPFAERSQENILALVQERVVEPKVVATWSLTDSLLRRGNIYAETAEKFPAATLEWRSWLTGSFITSPQNADATITGVRTAILGSLWVVLITLLFALPIGVGAAIYLEEYAADNWLNRLIKTNIDNLAGVPSIIYGMLGLAFFVRALEPLTSGTLVGVADPTTSNGRTILSAALTLALLVLPLIIINAQEAIRAVPKSLRDAGFGLGATKWQTIWAHVLPSALPGILTGNILAISRALGETAPLVVVGASTFITVDPTNPFSKFTTLPVQIYQWTARPQDEFRNIAAAAIIVLMLLLLSLNASAVIMRNRFSQKV